MAAPLVVLFHGAPLSGKSQLICWHISNQADPDTMPTFEENYEFFEEFQGHRETVTYLDTGGHASYATMLEEWVSRSCAQVLVLNLEDPSSLTFLRARQAVLAQANVRARIIVGNLPSGEEAKRAVAKAEAEKLAESLFDTQVPYLETNTRTGAGIGAVFSTLMACAHGIRVPAPEELKVAERAELAASTVQLAQKDAEIASLKQRQAELEATVSAFTLRVEALEARLSETTLARRVEELLLAHLKKNEWRRGPMPESDSTPVKTDVTKPLARELSIKQDLFLNSP